jgi:hypothetical protein
MTLEDISVSRRLLGGNPSTGTQTFVGPGSIIDFPSDFGCTVTAF